MIDKVNEWLRSVASYAADRVIPAVVILAAGLLTIRIVMTVLQKFLDASKLEKTAHSLINSLTRAALYLLLGLIVASALGIDVTGVIAMASVLTLAVSLAVQNALANVIGGFTLLYTRPFTSGDYVEVAGKSGTVREITMAYTKLTTPDNKVVSIPNSAVAAGDIVNYTVSGTRRVDITVRVDYSVPAQKVIDALVQAGTRDKVLLEPVPNAVISSYDTSCINYALRVWTKTEDFWDVTFAINQAIMDIFTAQGIQMAYPHMNVHIEQ